MKLYAEISKTEAQDDGTIKVFGYASSGTTDADGETITPQAMKAALPDYMKWGAVREMHQPQAAGTAIEARVDDDGKTFFGAHVVDPIAVKKVQAGVYKGFSIGGKVISRDDANKSVITGLRLVEVSLVDRPANPEAVMTCFKAEAVQKSLYSVSRIADLAAQVADFADYAEFEDGFEQRNPQLARQVREAARTLGTAMLELAGNEAEHIEQSAPEAGDGVDEFAADKVQLVESAPQANMGATPEAQGLDDNAHKLSGQLADARDALAKMTSERDAALQKLQAFEAQPQAPKAALKAVDKGADTASAPSDDALQGFAGICNADGSLNAAATLIKAAHAGLL